MNNFLRLIGRRLVALPIMALGVTVLVFFLMSFSKTDPAYTALGDGASPEAVAEYHEKYGLDDPWPVRYVRYMGDLIHGDMGTYGAARNSVAKRISTALPVTMQLTFIGLAIGAVVSFLLGVIAALYRDKWPDQVIRVFSIAGLATPSFWLAVLLILLFSSYLKVLPASGALPHFTTNPAGYLGRMIMPAIALAFPLTGQMTRIVRTAMVEELDKDYVRTARAKGMSNTAVTFRHILRNSMIPVVTYLGQDLGALMGGAMITEQIFNIHGIGYLTYQSILKGEANLVVSVVTLLTLVFVICNLIVDMLYAALDPRIRYV